MTATPGQLVVFVGPSLDPDRVRQMLPAAHVTSPVAHGDLERFHTAGATAFLIIDGLFAHRRAAGPAEIVDVLRSGAQVFGAASIGAIRAAECWPAGMLGVGAAYLLYRWRVISGDDEVAVAVDPDRRFAAVSTALLSIRFGLLAAIRERLLGHADASAVLTAAKRMHFSQRTWDAAFAAAQLPLTPELRRICERHDVKRRDALRAVEQLARVPPTACAPGERAGGPSGMRLPAARLRATGHDPQLGYAPARLRAELSRWLIGSGRYRRYLTTDAAAPRRPDELWSMLDGTASLEGEVMRWHAVKRAGAVRSDPPEEPWLSEARGSVCASHGFADWGELVDSVRDGELRGIPVAWIEEVCRSLALARRNVHEQERGATPPGG